MLDYHRREAFTVAQGKVSAARDTLRDLLDTSKGHENFRKINRVLIQADTLIGSIAEASVSDLLAELGDDNER